ncbi:MAG: lipase [Firmicutes bacterium]|nr:lipase [Bacillota bacterium]
MKIICYGDSNTYGYDPHGGLTLRYSAGGCWVDLVGNTLPEFCKIFNAGQNGREIPDNGWESAEGVAGQLAAVTEPGCAGGQKDLIIIMLGSNDVLLDGLSAEKTAMKMKRFLGAVKMEAPGRQILIIAPVSFRKGYWVPDQRYIEESEKLPGLYEQLAGEMDVRFADAIEWGFSLTDDGVHFTDDGHISFADGLTKVLKLWYSIS